MTSARSLKITLLMIAIGALWAPMALGDAAYCETLLAKAYASAAESIYPLRDLWARVRMPRAMKRFDSAAYRAACIQYRAGATTVPRTFESRLAFIEAASRRNSLLPPIDLGTIAESGSAVLRRRLASVVKTFESSRGLSRLQVESLAAEIYLIAEGSPYSLEYLAGHGRQAVARGVLYRVFQERLATDGLNGALRAAGLLAEPRVRDRLRTVVARKSVRIAMLVGLNLPMVVSGVPLYVPRERWVTWIEFPDALLRKVVEQGFDAAWPELQERYRVHLKADIAYSRVRPIVLAVVTGLLMKHFYQVIEQLQEEIREDEREGDRQADELIETVRKSVEPYESSVEPVSGVKRELFEEWVKKYRETHGVAPSPESEDYRRMRKLLLEP